MAETTRAREEIADLADELAEYGVIAGMIFGHRGLKTAARKMFCFEHGDNIVFKLPPAAYDDALALAGASLFAPHPGRPPMGNWVVVPKRYADQWPELARAAFTHVADRRGD